MLYIIARPDYRDDLGALTSSPVSHVGGIRPRIRGIASIVRLGLSQRQLGPDFRIGGKDDDPSEGLENTRCWNQSSSCAPRCVAGWAGGLKVGADDGCSSGSGTMSSESAPKDTSKHPSSVLLPRRDNYTAARQGGRARCAGPAPHSRHMPRVRRASCETMQCARSIRGARPPRGARRASLHKAPACDDAGSRKYVAAASAPPRRYPHIPSLATFGATPKSVSEGEADACGPSSDLGRIAGPGQCS